MLSFLKTDQKFDHKFDPVRKVSLKQIFCTSNGGGALNGKSRCQAQ
jgi:hypothetical protein